MFLREEYDIDIKEAFKQGLKGLEIPVIYDMDTNRILADINEHGQEYVVCKGGRGGRGNAKFATSTRQVPKFAEQGDIGEEFNLSLELKLIADILVACTDIYNSEEEVVNGINNETSYSLCAGESNSLHTLITLILLKTT